MAADLAGVSRETIYSYMNGDTEFIATYRYLKRGAEKAAAFIVGLLTDKESPASVKLSAAVKLLEIGAKYREAETAIDGATLQSLEGFHVMPETSPL